MSRGVHGLPGAEDYEHVVFVATGGKTAWRDVTFGLRGRDTVEVTEGLSAGETVVAPTDSKQPPLKPGQRVAVK